MLAEQKEHDPRAKFTRSRALGWYYETEQIKWRIAQYQGGMMYVPKIKVRQITPKVENLEKHIASLQKKLSKKNTEYNQADK